MREYYLPAEFQNASCYDDLPALLQADICFECTKKIFDSSDVFQVSSETAACLLHLIVQA